MKKIIFLLLVLFAFFLRFYQIDQIPASLYYDEVDYGYQARSLIETRKDYKGSWSPFYVHSFNDIRLPIPAYLTVLTTLLFKTPELQVRMPFVLAGTAVVVLSFLITLGWTKKFWPAFFVAAVFAISPWQIQFSRFSHEAMVMALFYMGGLFTFYKSIHLKKYTLLVLSIILFSLSVYTQRTMSFFIPITLVILFILYYKDLLRYGLKKSFLSILASLVIISSFLAATTIKAPDIPRINQLSITADKTIPIWVQRNREIDSGDYTDSSLGKKAVWYSYFFHSKPLSFLESFAKNYLQTFSTEFLLIDGDPNRRHSVGGVGEILFIDILGLIFGLIFLGKNLKQNHFKFILFWFLLSPIPASLTVDGARHASRLFIFSAPLLIIIGLGWWHVVETMKKFKFSKILLLLIFTLYALQFTFFLHRYFVHYPIESARYFGYGVKQAMQKISQIEQNYKKVVMVPDYEPPMIYYLFWSDTRPEHLQEYGSAFSEDIIKDKKLDKYKVSNLTSIDNLEQDTLYLVTQNQVKKDLRNQSPPEGMKLIDTFFYPDKEVAFYLIEKD